MLSLFISTYNALLTKLLSPFTPVLENLVEDLSRLWGFDLTLQDYWKHIFVLLSIYFFSRAAGAYKLQTYGTAVFRLVWGLSSALSFSLLASVETNTTVPNFDEHRIALSAITCVAIYELGVNVWFSTFFRQYQAEVHQRTQRDWLSEFCHLSKEDGVRFLSGIVLTTAMLQLPWPQGVTRPELVVLAVITLVHGMFWMFWGWRQTRFEPKLSTRLKIAKTNSDITVGIAMVRSFFYAFIVVAIDAAARLM